MRVSGLSSPSTAWCELASVTECQCCSSACFHCCPGETSFPELAGWNGNHCKYYHWHISAHISPTEDNEQHNNLVRHWPCFLPGCLQGHMVVSPCKSSAARFHGGTLEDSAFSPWTPYTWFLMLQLSLVSSCFTLKFASQLPKCQTKFQSLVIWTFSCYCFFFTFLPVT